MKIFSILLLGLVFMSSSPVALEEGPSWIVSFDQVETGTTVCPDGRVLHSYAIMMTLYHEGSGATVTIHEADLVACCECSQGVSVENIVLNNDDIDPEYVMDEGTFTELAIQYYQTLQAQKGN